MKVGYFGPSGTFTEQAARKLFEGPGESPCLQPFRTIPEILHNVEKGHLDAGVAPIENSIEGSVAVTLDALVHEVKVQICAEVVLPVVHHLMVKPGTDLEQVEAVLSHPQALAQCRRNLERLLPGVAQWAATSTAEAARTVADDRRPLAALGTDLAASLYGLSILRSHLQDLADNATRFIAVRRGPSPRSGFDKTSLVFSFGLDRPGNLYRALKVFADREINLTKLESRPAKQSLGEYLFFVDAEGHTEDETLALGLDELRHQCAFFKVLGSYPRVEYERVRA